MPIEDPFPAGLHSSNWKSRARAIENLALSRTNLDEIYPVLFACLYDQEPTVRMIASYYLHKVSPETILKRLEEMFAAPETQIRWSALVAAEGIQESFLVSLLKKLNDPDPNLQSRINLLVKKITNVY